MLSRQLPARPIVLSLAIAIHLGASGCAYTNSIFRSHVFTDDPPSSASVDAKQRLIIASKVDGKSVICAEPSPDALSVVSASFAAQGNISPEQAIQLAMSSAESGSNIGLRTQSIQLLRDALYRACEGYASGALSAAEYNRLQVRYQKIMVSLLAIEQLTGAAKPTVSILKTSSQADFGKNLVLAEKNLDDGREAQADREKKANEAKTNLDDATKAADEAAKALPDAQADLKTKTDLANKLAGELKDLEAKTPKPSAEIIAAKKKEVDAASEAKTTAEKSVKDLEEKKKAAVTSKTEKSTSLENAKKAVEDGKAAVAKLEEQFQAAQSVSTSAQSEGTVHETVTPQINPEVMKVLAPVVQSIIQQVFDQDSAANQCIEAARAVDAQGNLIRMGTFLKDWCDIVFKALDVKTEVVRSSDPGGAREEAVKQLRAIPFPY